MPRNPVIHRIVNWNQFVTQKTCKLDKRQRTLQKCAARSYLCKRYDHCTFGDEVQRVDVDIRGSAGYLPFTWGNNKVKITSVSSRTALPVPQLFHNSPRLTLKALLYTFGLIFCVLKSLLQFCPKSFEVMLVF